MALRHTLLLSLLAVSLMASGKTFLDERPKLLIVQIPQRGESRDTPDLLLDAYLADELDNLGQVSPIVWSPTDAIFRSWQDSGKVSNNLHPTEENARQVARQFHIPYVLIVAAIKEDRVAKPVGRLYRTNGNRPVWSFADIEKGSLTYSPVVRVNGKVDKSKTDELLRNLGDENSGTKGFIVLVNGLPDWDSTSRSIARTWTQLLAASEFRDLPENRRLPITASIGGRPQTEPAALPVAPIDAQAEVDRCLKQKRPDLAILVLRDAIDQNPFDGAIRSRLAWLLFDQGLPAAAAEEAEGAARLNPNHLDLWLLAARGWMIAGKPDSAQTDVNQALARGGKEITTRSLLGDVYLLQGKYEAAAQQYSISISAGPKPEAIAGRAIAYAMMGQPTECQADLAILHGIPASALGRSYDMAIQLIETTNEHLAENLRSLPPAIRLSPKSPEVVIRAQLAERLARALSNLVSAFPYPPEHQKSHQGRDLAQKLLSQSAQEILDFARTGDSDIGDEAVLSLGEGLKLLPTVKEYYKLESGQS